MRREEVTYWPNVRGFLKAFIGARVVDITQSDADDARDEVTLMFDNGATLTFPIGDDGFQWEEP